MKNNSLEEKLELYYDKLQNPDKVIDNWAIIDIPAYTKLNKTTLTNINDININKAEKIITAESKSSYVVIKYNANFIATKVIEREYDYLLKDWDLIAVDRQVLYKGEPSKVMTNKEIIKTLGIKLGKKAIKDLDSFN
jgi:hypothetical protein